MSNSGEELQRIDLARERAHLVVNADASTRLRSKNWVAPLIGTRIRADQEIDQSVRIAALNKVMADDVVFSGPTAAWLLDLPVPLWADDGGRQLHVTTPMESRHLVRADVVTRRSDIPPKDVLTIDGFRVTSPPRTYADLAAMLRLPDLVAVGDVLVRRSVDLADLAQAIKDRGRGRGVVDARRSLTMLDGRSESPPESRVRIICREAGLPLLTPQWTVTDEWGQFVARLDLYNEEYGIGVEYDGEYHFTREQRTADAGRRSMVGARGVLLVEIVAGDMSPESKVVDKVRRAFISRGWRPTL